MDPNDLQAKAKEQARKARDSAEKQAKWASEQAKKVAVKVKEEVQCCSTPALASMRVPTDAGTPTSMHRFTPTAMHVHTLCRDVLSSPLLLCPSSCMSFSSLLDWPPQLLC